MITRLPGRILSSSAISKSAFRSPRCPKLHKAPQGRQSFLFPRTRHYSTSPPPPTPEAQRPSDLRSQFPSSPGPQYTVPPKPKRSLRPYIYATFFLFLGLTAGQYVRLVIAPPKLPDADTKEDKLMVEFLHKQAESLHIVQSLSTDPNWTSHDAWEGSTPEYRRHTLSIGPLGGARALGGYRRIFINNETGECVAVVWFGGAIAGWPGVTHGGVIATIMDETLGRTAIRQFPSKTGVTANLEINYMKPVVTNSFYIIRSFPQEGFTDTKGWVNGRLETLEGRVCVESKALFVVPKKFRTRKIENTI